MSDDNSVVDALLRAGLTEAVVDRGHPDYHDSRRVWNGAFDRYPLAIVKAAHAADAQRAIGVAQASGVPLAVRGGGHSLAGFSTCDDGIVLDLSRINGVAVDASDQTVRVGGGALLHDLDTASVASGVVVPAGIVSHTGVAGLTLGGGMGWNSRRYGLTIDSLIGVELVTADGELLVVDEDSDSELFWALRGGGGNFGAVTNFLFRSHELGEVVVARSRYQPTDAFNVLMALAAFSDGLSHDQSVGFSLTQGHFSVTNVWFGSGSEADQALEPTGKLGAVATQTDRYTFLELQHASDEASAWGVCCYSKGAFLPKLDRNFVSLLVEQLNAAPTVDCEVYVIQLGGAVTDIGEGDTAYSGRSAAFYCVVTAFWEDPVDREATIAWGRETSTLFADWSMTTNYVNEQSEGDADFVRRAYGAEKYERLLKVKRRLDPNNLFRLNQNILP